MFSDLPWGGGFCSFDMALLHHHMNPMATTTLALLAWRKPDEVERRTISGERRSWGQRREPRDAGWARG